MNSLMVFEAASRHENFVRAANELCVTPGAVSRQIRKLEEHLGLDLFVRAKRRVTLTQAGVAYGRTVQAIFDQIRRDTTELVMSQQEEPLRVWCSNLFTRHWLLPRLSIFHEQHPSIPVVFSINRHDDPLDSGFDLAVLLGNGDWPGLVSELLMHNSYLPVCSPKYLTEHAPLRSVGDFCNHTLLFSTKHPEHWHELLRSAGFELPTVTSKMTFSGDALAYQAALEGVGIALGRLCFLDGDLASGRLIIPLNIPERMGKDGYYLVFRDGPEPRRGMTEFRNWLLAEVRRQKINPSPAHAVA